MRTAFRLVLILLLWIMASAGARAAIDDSRIWFEGLTDAERTGTQTSLILTGHYNYLVDGQFGQGTFDALTAFQRSQGSWGDGVLTPAQAERLRTLAWLANLKLGMEQVDDSAAHATMIIPKRVLTISTPSAAGTSYASEDGEFSLETMYAPLVDISFEDLFDAMTAPDPERVVTYRTFGSDRFVVSGVIGEYSYYTLFVRSGAEAVGYSLAWGKTYESEGAITAVYIASHFQPLAGLPPGNDVKTVAVPTAPQQGAFELPADQPDVIFLNAEITPTTAQEFERALLDRPDVRVVVLNSPGGAVDAGLAVAREVNRRGLTTYVPPGMGCYSACAYIFFAGASRTAVGELGVHQISAEVADLVLAQTTLGDMLDALELFGVHQQVISNMLRTPPEEMYVFSPAEIADLGINRGDVVDVAVAPPPAPEPLLELTPLPTGVVAFVQLSSQSSSADAQRSLDYASGRWGTIFGDMRPEVQTDGQTYHVRLPAPSLERANTICAAIKADGGGCYVTSAER